MAYHTPIYLFLFLPLTIVCYALCPQKHRCKVLLIFSYLFFYSVSRKLLFYLVGATVLTHYVGVWLETLHRDYKEKVKKGLEAEEKKALKAAYVRKERLVLLFGIVILVGCLAYLKYYNFYAVNANVFLNQKGIGGFRFNIKNIMVPVGISF